MRRVSSFPHLVVICVFAAALFAQTAVAGSARFVAAGTSSTVCSGTSCQRVASLTNDPSVTASRVSPEVVRHEPPAEQPPHDRWFQRGLIHRLIVTILDGMSIPPG